METETQELIRRTQEIAHNQTLLKLLEEAGLHKQVRAFLENLLKEKGLEENNP